MIGASIRCTILPIRFKMPLRDHLFLMLHRIQRPPTFIRVGLKGTWISLSLPGKGNLAGLSLTGVVTSKRFLRQLVEGGYVDGWDDPRLPTLQGLRRRGYTPESIRSFIEEIGSIRTQSTVDISLLDHFLRQDLKEKTVSVMAVIAAVKSRYYQLPRG